MRDIKLGPSLVNLAIFLIIALLAAVFIYLVSAGHEIGRLPGDISVAVRDLNIQFPLVTSILVSAIINLSIYLVYRVMRDVMKRREAREFEADARRLHRRP
jgi:uncharacterized protein HemY